MSLDDDVRDFLTRHWHGVDDAAYRAEVVAAGWAAPDWPPEACGRGLDRRLLRGISKAFTDAGAPDPVRSSRPYALLLGRTALQAGSPELQADVLPKLLTGEWETGCLLYSEPGNGSDLAGLQTRAVRDGDDFVVTGHKVWSTDAHRAQVGLLLARTDPDVPKHRGISFFVLDMSSPGIEVRPIAQMTGERDFTEVILTDVRVPARHIVGAEGDGWRVLQLALKEERKLMGLALGAHQDRPDGRPAIFTASDDLIDAARAAGRLQDEDVRQEIMRNHAWRLVNRWNGQRARQELARGGSSLASLGKLETSRIMHEGGALRFRLQGAAGLLYDYDDPQAHRVGQQLMWAFFTSIGGGTDQIQRNIIAERVLGLPKGPEPDRDAPFRATPKGGIQPPGEPAR